MGSEFTLVVQVHPLEQSYNAALRDRVVAELESAGGMVICHRLAQGERPGAGELATAGRLVLVYPTWSGGLPSALLGWIHGLFDDGTNLPCVRELVAVTTCGSSQVVNRVQGEWGRRYLRTELLGRCASGARFRWLPLYKVDRRSQLEMRRHLDTVARRLVSVS
jgi:NAD(P)H dehydrogenase (quinone)